MSRYEAEVEEYKETLRKMYTTYTDQQRMIEVWEEKFCVILF
jgi:hypothetical protein